MGSVYISRKEVELVFEAWKKHKKNPSRCRLLVDRERLIKSRLRIGYSAEDLVTVVDFIHLSDDSDAEWMRGKNPRRRAYLDLANILRVERLAGRVEAAHEWKEDSGKDVLSDSNPWELR